MTIAIIDRVEERDENGKFVRSKITYKDGNEYYIATSSVFQPEEINARNVLELKLDRTHIPHSHIFPLQATGISIIESHNPLTCYVKQPGLSYYDASDPSKIPNDFLEEARVMAMLSKSPHPNIVKYFGCLGESGRIVGICLEKCVETLYDRTWIKKMKVETDRLVRNVQDAVCHLHQLGYCHNDLSIHNVMFRHDGTVVIIDFDACRPTGKGLGSKKGTPGFCDLSATLSERQNDYFSIDRVKDYLMTGVLPV